MNGITTTGPAGISFRSRIEAQWAYVFDVMGFDWEYEPLDLKGYIPDFILKYKGTPILIEIKGDCDIWSSFLPHKEKIDKSGWSGKYAILGSSYKYHEEYNTPDKMWINIGKVFDNDTDNDIDDDLVVRQINAQKNVTWEIGGSVMYDCLPGDWKSSGINSFEQIWSFAKNATQWKGSEKYSTASYRNVLMAKIHDACKINNLTINGKRQSKITANDNHHTDHVTNLTGSSSAHSRGGKVIQDQMATGGIMVAPQSPDSVIAELDKNYTSGDSNEIETEYGLTNQPNINLESITADGDNITFKPSTISIYGVSTSKNNSEVGVPGEITKGGVCSLYTPEKHKIKTGEKRDVQNYQTSIVLTKHKLTTEPIPKTKIYTATRLLLLSLLIILFMFAVNSDVSHKILQHFNINQKLTYSTLLLLFTMYLLKFTSALE
tara:strand:+ start:202 stop:1503 length:1302 start_codon:yes stop_codon:yes gene_type:complete